MIEREQPNDDEDESQNLQCLFVQTRDKIVAHTIEEDDSSVNHVSLSR